MVEDPDIFKNLGTHSQLTFIIRVSDTDLQKEDYHGVRNQMLRVGILME